MPDPNGLNFKTQEILDQFTALGVLVSDMWTNTNLIPDLLTALNTVAENQGAESLIFEDISAALGLNTGDATTTVLGHLAAIESLLTCICGTYPPPTSGAGACEAPSSSLAGFSYANDSFPGREFAVWPDPLPDGLSPGGADPLQSASASVNLSDSTGTYSYYVQSKAPTHRPLSDSGVSYPNNTWLSVTPGIDLEVNVPTGADVQVFLCYAPAPTFDTCVDITAVSNHYHNFVGNVQKDNYSPDWSGVPGATSVDNANFGTDVYTWNSGTPVLTSNANGWSFKLLTGPVDLRLFLVAADNSYSLLGSITTATYLTITTDTYKVWIDSGSNEAAYTFQVCPPA